MTLDRVKAERTSDLTHPLFPQPASPPAPPGARHATVDADDHDVVPHGFSPMFAVAVPAGLAGSAVYVRTRDVVKHDGFKQLC